MSPAARSEYRNGIINISITLRTHGMSPNVSDVLFTFPDTSFRGFGVIAGYDRKYREVLFTFLNSYKSITICLSEMLGAYTSL